MFGEFSVNRKRIKEPEATARRHDKRNPKGIRCMHRNITSIGATEGIISLGTMGSI
jgi:hypothetical protein